MKNRLMSALLALVAVCSIGFVSCKKETVVQQNASNNAYSEVLTVNPNQWSSNGNGGFSVSYTTPSNLPWGSFIYGTDLVLLYITATSPTQSGGEEYPLMGNGTILGNYSFYYGVSYNNNNKTGVVTITADPISNGITSAPNVTLYFHSVYIQPYTANDLQSSSKVNLNDYNAVKTFYNLKN